MVDATAGGRFSFSSPFQQYALEAAYLMERSPKEDKMAALAEQAGIGLPMVRRWFGWRNGDLDLAALDSLREAEGNGTPAAATKSVALAQLREHEEKVRQRELDRQVREVANAKVFMEVAGEPFREDGPPLSCVFDEVPAELLPAKARKRARAPSGAKQMQKAAKLARLAAERSAKIHERELNRIRKREELEVKKLAQEAQRRQKEAEREAERALKMQLKIEAAERREQDRLESFRKKEAEKREREQLRLAAKKARDDQKATERMERERARMEAIAERERKKELRRREREAERARVAEERARNKARRQEVTAKPVLLDDLEVEQQALRARRQEEGFASGAEDAEAPATPETLPEFPGADVKKGPCLAPEIPEACVGGVLAVWTFLRNFGSSIGMPSVSLEELVTCMLTGESSYLLSTLHVRLLRLIQADVEEAHGLLNSEEGAESARAVGSAIAMDRSVQNCAEYLQEAWAWHYNNDVWRAHLNLQTWPEILRQCAVTFGYGQERPAPKVKKGELGEAGDDAEGPKLNIPRAWLPRTLKHAAFTVLARVGPEGMTVAEICKTIDEEGLIHRGKSVESSINGALSREPFVFERLGKCHFALKRIVAWHKKQEALKAEREAEAEKLSTPAKKAKEEATKKEAEEKGGVGGQDVDPPLREAEGWVTRLGEVEYDELTVEERLRALTALMDIAADCPSVYQMMEAYYQKMDETKKMHRDGLKLIRHRLWNNSAQMPRPEDIKRELDAIKARQKATMFELQSNIRSGLLGMDRRWNKYWVISERGDRPGAEAKCRIVIESADGATFATLAGPASLRRLFDALNPLGYRECALQENLQACFEDLSARLVGGTALPKKEKLSEEESGWQYQLRLGAQDNLPGSRESEVDVLKKRAGDSVKKVDKLRADMLDYQFAAPRDVYVRGNGFDADIWRAKVQTAESPLALRDLLAELEAAFDPDSFCTDFHHFAPFVIPGAFLPVQSNPEAEDEVVVGEEIPIGVHLDQGNLSWLPATTSGVSMRLQSLDAATSFRKGQKASCLKNDAYKYIQRDFAVNDDGTNFTSIAPSGLVRIGADAALTFPAFPEVASLPGPGFMLPVAEFAKQLRSTGFYLDESGREVGPSVAAGMDAEAGKDEDEDGDFFMQDAEPKAAEEAAKQDEEGEEEDEDEDEDEESESEDESEEASLDDEEESDSD